MILFDSCKNFHKSFNLNPFLVVLLFFADFTSCKDEKYFAFLKNNKLGKTSFSRNKQSSVRNNEKCEIGKCLPHSSCFLYLNHKYIKTCVRSNGANGICCSPEEITNTNTGGRVKLSLISDHKTNDFHHNDFKETITTNQWNRAQESAMNYIKRVDKLEDMLQKSDLLARVGTEEFWHSANFGNDPQVLNYSRNGLISLQTNIQLTKNQYISPDEDKSLKSNNFMVRNSCDKEPKCLNAKYRTPDGSCNNRRQKSWGKSMIAYNRVLRPAYSDGINGPRVASDGRPLPNARQISIELAPDRNKPNQRYTLLLMQFGQFLNHDILMTAMTMTHTNSPIRCCDESFRRNPRLLHPSCLQISISKNDPFYGPIGQTCMNFVRSAPAPNCELGPREQMNQLTSYIDSSNIYGSTAQQSASLRSFRGGLLRTTLINNREFLPFNRNSTTCAINRQTRLNCFLSGDQRVNQQPDLVVLHALWLREHNRIAKILSKLNPNWNDQIVYEESRRIVSAEFQHIVYNEYLPIIIGRDLMKSYGLFPLRTKFSNSYSSDINAGIISGFASAAFRFHTLVQGTIELRNKNNKISNKLLLRTQFNNPQILYRSEAFESLIYGLTGQNSQNGDNYFSTDVTNHLFQTRNQSFGLDLFAINVQRGRDHGIPGYNEWRQICGLKRIGNFNQLNSVMNRNVAQTISRIYRNVDDIDFFVGGVSENHVKGALVGPTFACIIAEQFRRLKNGDRFWYENGNMKTSFTRKQLKQIRKSSLARILCDNSDIKTVQPLPMLISSKWNAKVRCKSNHIPRLQLKEWANKKVWN